MIRSIIRRITVAGLVALMVLPAAAQNLNWPLKPVRFIVPFPPGGTVDPLARLLGTRLSAALGQQFIIDKFHAELVKVLDQPDLRKQLTEQLGMDLAVSTPEALQKWTVGEIARWGKVVRENNISAE